MPAADLSNLSARIAASASGERGVFLVPAPRFKTTLQVVLLPPLDVWATLDAALVSDYVVLLMSSADEVQLEGEGVLRCLQGQVGGTNIVSCMQVSPCSSYRSGGG